MVVTSGESYLFYSNGNGVSAVDPATPAEPITVASGEVNDYPSASFVFGNYDANARKVTGLHDYATVYFNRADWKLYKVSAVKGGGAPVPTQLSNELLTGANSLCTDEYEAEDFVDINNTQYVYIVAGADGFCNTADDVHKMVRLGMTASDAPIIAKDPVTVIGDDNGANIGWLVRDGGSLKRCDKNFANCFSIVTATTIRGIGDSSDGSSSLLNIDGNIHVYKIPENSLSASLHTVGSGDVYWVESDGADYYFPDGTRIYKLPVDGSANAAVLVTEAGGLTISIEGVRGGHVVYGTSDSSSSRALKAVSVNGGAPITLVTASGAGSHISAGWGWGVAGSRVYYNKTAGGGESSGVIGVDGSNHSEMANSSWVGLTLPTSLSLDDLMADKLYRVTGISATGSFANGTLESVDVATNGSPVVLGTLPGDVTSFICGIGFGSNSLCSASSNSATAPSSSQTDLFFVNAETANSLVRVTNTPDKSEMPFY